MAVPTQAAYDAALKHQSEHEADYEATEPSDEVLANVAVIRAYQADVTSRMDPNGAPDE